MKRSRRVSLNLSEDYEIYLAETETGRSIMWGWDSICSAARKVDRTVREDAPAKLKQYTPDPKQLQHVVSYCSGSLSGRYPAEKMSEIQKIMRSNWDYLREKAPEKHINWINAGKCTSQIIAEIIHDSGLPGAKPLSRVMYKASMEWMESQRDRNSVASHLHGHEKEKEIGEKISIHDDERAVEREKYMVLREELLRMVALTKPTKASQIGALTNQPFSPEAVIKAFKQSQVSQDCSDNVERG